MRAGEKLTLLLVLLILITPLTIATTDRGDITINSPASMTPGDNKKLCEVAVMPANPTAYTAITTSPMHFFAPTNAPCDRLYPSNPISFYDTTWSVTGYPVPKEIAIPPGKTMAPVFTSLGQRSQGTKLKNGPMTLTTAAKEILRWDGDGRGIQLQNANINAQLFELHFNTYTNSPSTDFVFKTADADKAYTNDGEKIMGTEMQGWMLVDQNEPTYKFPVYCGDVRFSVQSPINDFENMEGDWLLQQDFNKYSCDLSGACKYQFTEKDAGGDNWMILQAMYNPTTKALNSYAIYLRDGSPSSGGFKYQVWCENSVSAQYICEAQGHDWGPEAPPTPPETYCCGPEGTLGNTITDGTNKWICTQQILVPQWLYIDIIPCGANPEGERVSTDPFTYCCRTGSDYDDAPHLYDTSTSDFITGFTPQPLYCLNNELQDTVMHDEWLYYDGSWLTCGPTTQNTLRGAYLCSKADEAWERCTCPTGTEEGCGESTLQIGWYCATGNTWTIDPDAPGACKPGQTYNSTATGTNKCCRQGTYGVGTVEEPLTDELSVYYHQVCYNGILVNETDATPATILDTLTYTLP